MPVRQMTSAILAVAFVFGVTVKPSSAVADAQAAEALVAKARALEDLRADGAKPFLLRATVTVQRGKQQGTGDYGLNWWSSERWQESVKFSDFARGREGVKGGYWQSRLTDFQPEAIFEMDKAIDPMAMLRLQPDERLGKISQDKNHGDPLSCLQVNAEKYLARTLCFEQSSGKLVRVKIDYSPFGGGGSIIDYSDFTPLGEKQFPGKITFTTKEGSAVAIAITKIAALTSPAPADVTKGSNSEFWHWCDDAVEPIIETQIQPKYPQESKNDHEQGSVKMYMKIDENGGVTNLHVLSSPSQRLAQASADAVSQWRYKPATCGGTPVAREAVTTVIYTLSG